MSSARHDLKSRSGLRPRSLIHVLIGAGCARVLLALVAGNGSIGASPSAIALQWILSASSLILLAMLDRGVQERHPGIGSLFRGGSYAALAGSLLPCAASLLVVTGSGGAPALAAALVGLALTLSGAVLLEWLVGDAGLDGPLPRESVALARLTSLSGILRASASRAGRLRGGGSPA